MNRKLREAIIVAAKRLYHVGHLQNLIVQEDGPIRPERGHEGYRNGFWVTAHIFVDESEVHENDE